MTATPEFRPAKRGDGVVVETRHTGYMIPGPGKTEPYDYHQYEVGVVTGITRDGHVRTWRPAWVSEDEHDRHTKQGLPFNKTQIWLLPATEMDVPACLAAYQAHTYPGHADGLPKPYDTLAEVRDALRPHQLTGEQV